MRCTGETELRGTSDAVGKVSFALTLGGSLACGLIGCETLTSADPAAPSAARDPSFLETYKREINLTR